LYQGQENTTVKEYQTMAKQSTTKAHPLALVSSLLSKVTEQALLVFADPGRSNPAAAVNGSGEVCIYLANPAAASDLQSWALRSAYVIRNSDKLASQTGKGLVLPRTREIYLQAAAERAAVENIAKALLSSECQGEIVRAIFPAEYTNLGEAVEAAKEAKTAARVAKLAKQDAKPKPEGKPAEAPYVYGAKGDTVKIAVSGIRPGEFTDGKCHPVNSLLGACQLLLELWLKAEGGQEVPASDWQRAVDAAAFSLPQLRQVLKVKYGVDISPVVPAGKAKAA
jgi:hypothetical protein